MGDNIYPLTKSGMMSPVLFLLPILICVAQAEPSGKFLLIDTVDDEESGRRADYIDDYQINIGGFPSWWSSFADRFPSMVRPVVVQPQPIARDPCGAVQCNGSNVFNNSARRQDGKDYQDDYQISSKNSVTGCCNNNQNIVGNINGR